MYVLAAVLAALAILTPAAGADVAETASIRLARLQTAPDEFETDGQVLLQTQAVTSSFQGGHSRLLEHEPSMAAASPPEPEAKLLHVPEDWVLNIVVVIVLAVVVVFTAVGFYSGSEGWVIAMFVASYLILIPGLFSKDFSFNIAVNVDFKALGLPPSLKDLLKVLMPNFPSRIQITQPRGHYGPIHESTRSLVGFLHQSGSTRGAVLIAIFAFAMPGVKLILLTIGLSLRHSKRALCTGIAGWSIFFVQVISKWAAPDMFAMILLFHLLHGLDHPPLIESLQAYDVGFTFYSVFCVFSVISTLAVKAPAEERPSAAAPAPAVLRALGHHGVHGLALALSAAWLVLFVAGLWTPCLAMDLDKQQLLSQFHMPAQVLKMLKPVTDRLSAMMSDEVSVWACTWDTLHWFALTGRLNLLMSALMLIVLVLALTVLDMLAILWAAHRLFWGGAKGAGGAGGNRALEFMHVLRHLSFMDVLVVGVITVGYVAEMYASQGILVTFRSGLWLLAASECCHWGAFLLVRSASGE